MPEPPLTEAHQRALEALRRDGIAILPFSALLEDQELWAQLADDARRFAESIEPSAGAKPGKGGGKSKKSDFILRASASPDFRPPDPLLRYALSDGLLGLSNAYLGERSKGGAPCRIRAAPCRGA